MTSRSVQRLLLRHVFDVVVLEHADFLQPVENGFQAIVDVGALEPAFAAGDRDRERARRRLPSHALPTDAELQCGNEILVLLARRRRLPAP